jgi:hypothetical protein
MILEDTSLLKTFLCPFGRFEHDTRHFFALSGVVFLFGLWSFLSFSSLVLLPGVFLSNYLFIECKSHKKGPPNLVGSNQTCIVFYFIGKRLGQRMKGM